MKKMVLVAALLAVTSGSTFAADMVTKAKPMAPAAFDPWDFAFGSAMMSDYVFRGITQSNHKPSVAAYFEPRYNLNKDLQLYIGTSGESISFPNRAAAEIDVYGGIRPTFGAFAFDFGVFGYLYPGGHLLSTVRPSASQAIRGPAQTVSRDRFPALTATSPSETQASTKSMARLTTRLTTTGRSA